LFTYSYFIRQTDSTTDLSGTLTLLSTEIKALHALTLTTQQISNSVFIY